MMSKDDHLARRQPQPFDPPSQSSLIAVNASLHKHRRQRIIGGIESEDGPSSILQGKITGLFLPGETSVCEGFEIALRTTVHFVVRVERERGSGLLLCWGGPEVQEVVLFFIQRQEVACGPGIVNVA